jgi:hypothetical protein
MFTNALSRSNKKPLPKEQKSEQVNLLAILAVSKN